MRDPNISFLETYKSVDMFIRDAYGTKEGVSYYIGLMEKRNPIGRGIFSRMDGGLQNAQACQMA